MLNEIVCRENKGWTQKELSERTGIAIPNISLMEAGKRPIGARTAKKLAE
ncbi:helix-turn-helix transcriptional regulator [Treponema sp.]|nr:helix-turn-helix transcriptional regulator [Treponema sp.]